MAAHARRSPTERLVAIENALLSLARKTGHSVASPHRADPYGDDDHDGTLNMFDTAPFRVHAGSEQRANPHMNGSGDEWLQSPHQPEANLSQMTNALMTMMLIQLLNDLKQSRSADATSSRPLSDANSQSGGFLKAHKTWHDYDRLRRHYRKLYGAYFYRISSYAGILVPRHTTLPPAAFTAEHYTVLKASYTLLYHQAERIDRQGLRLLDVLDPASV